MQATGAQAYAVTLCRAAETLATGRLVSKLAAANAGRSRFPEWSALIDWAQDWWYHSGSDFDHGRFEDVRRFVNDVSARSLPNREQFGVWAGVDRTPSPRGR